MLLTPQWPRARRNLTRLLLLDCHDVVMNDEQILLEDVEDDLLSHHLIDGLLPLTRKELAYNFNKHGQRLVLDRARLKSALVQRGEEGGEEDKTSPLQEHLHELRDVLSHRLLCCGNFVDFSAALQTSTASNDALMHQHNVVEVACGHASVLTLAEQLGPHAGILVRLMILQHRHAVDLLIYSHEHLVVDW